MDQSFTYTFPKTNHTYTISAVYEAPESEVDGGEIRYISSGGYLFSSAVSEGVEYTEEQLLDREDLGEDELREIVGEYATKAFEQYADAHPEEFWPPHETEPDVTAQQEMEDFEGNNPWGDWIDE